MEPFELPHRHEDASHLHELEEYLRRTEYFQTVALVFRQLSDANRVRLFWLLCHCEECVVNLAAMMGMSPPALSHHLRQLRESGLIVKAIDGADDLCQGGSDIAVHRFVVQHRELFIIIADIGAQRGVLRAEEATDLVQSGGTAGFVFFDDGSHKIGILIFYVSSSI